MNKLTFCDEEIIQLGRESDLIEDSPQESLLGEDLFLFHIYQKQDPFLKTFFINQYDELGVTFQEENPSNLFYAEVIHHQDTSDTLSSFQEEIFKRNAIKKSWIQKYPKLYYPSYNIIQHFSAISDISNIINPYDIKIMHCIGKSNIEKEKLQNDEKIVEKLSDISTRLKKVTHYSEKLRILDELNEFLSKHKNQIKKEFSDKLVSILNSL